MNRDLDFSCEITKTTKLYEVNNDKCHNFWYGIYGRIYNKDKSRYRRFKFVVLFDIFDVQEYYEDKDFISKVDIKQYMIDYAYSTMDSFSYEIKSYNNMDGLKKFYALCSETIKDYNKVY